MTLKNYHNLKITFTSKHKKVTITFHIPNFTIFSLAPKAFSQCPEFANSFDAELRRFFQLHRSLLVAVSFSPLCTPEEYLFERIYFIYFKEYLLYLSYYLISWR